MIDLDRINARLDTIEGLLRQLLGRDTGAGPMLPASDLYAEIARVKAAGGDMTEHFKEKARRAMRQAAAEKKAQRANKRVQKGTGQ